MSNPKDRSKSPGSEDIPENEFPEGFDPMGMDPTIMLEAAFNKYFLYEQENTEINLVDSLLLLKNTLEEGQQKQQSQADKLNELLTRLIVTLEKKMN